MDNLKFEDALKKLEEIVKNLETKDISLDEAVKNYQEGIELSKYCYDKLDEASKVIVKKMDGEELTDFDLE